MNKPVVVLVPVCLIMLLGVAGLFVGELKRYREDKVVNATPVKRLALPGSPEHANNPKGEIRWENSCLADIKVGDIIRIDDLEQVPADCILLKVSDNKPECFVKTAALDGERNLKPKLANAQLSENFETLFGPKSQQSRADLTVNCIEPIKELYYFEGRLKANLPDEPEFKQNIDLN